MEEKMREAIVEANRWNDLRRENKRGNERGLRREEKSNWR